MSDESGHPSDQFIRIIEPYVKDLKNTAQEVCDLMKAHTSILGETEQKAFSDLTEALKNLKKIWED